MTTFIFYLLISIHAQENLTTISVRPNTSYEFYSKENVINITSEDIKKSTAANLPELLNEFTSVYVSDTGNNGKSYSVDLMGFGETAGSNVLVLLNGIKLNESDLSNTDFLQIPIKNIERIEILKSSKYSVLYGDNSDGGIINIVTKEGKNFISGGELNIGSYETISSNLYFQKSFSDFSTGFFINNSNTDGYRDNSYLKKSDLSYNLNFFGSNYSILFETMYHRDEYGLPGALFESELLSTYVRTETKTPNDFGESDSYIIRLKPEIELNKDTKFIFDVSYRDKSAAAEYGSYLASSEITVLNLEPKVEYYTNNNQFVTGVNYKTASSQALTGTMRRDIFDVFLYDKYLIFEKLFLDGGYRYSNANYEYVDAKTTASNNSFLLGLDYNYLKDSNVYLNFSKSYRYPLLDEYYVYDYNLSTYEITGGHINSNLKEQNSYNIELGTKYTFTEYLASNLNIFYKNTDHEIFFNPYTFENSNLDGSSERLGADLSFTFINSFIDAKVFYTYLYNYIKSGTFEGKNIPNVPNNIAGFNLTFKPIKNTFLSFNGKFIGSRYFTSDFNNEFSEQKSYFVLNSQLKYVLDVYTFFVNLNNITNQDYSYGVIGYNWSSFANEKAYYPANKFNMLAGVKMDIN